ncbi:LPS export ABC transporter permease LptG [Pseudaeromonas sharmana]|uniref:LPS export ABC transporter permease LptG n=1 Tax=Pseudaeromonas sharmana TaxID=328412 RepID=A0ABV8CKJ4_9GAMM
MFGILDRYVGRSVLMAILLCTLLLVGLSALIKYVEQLKQVGEGNYDAIAAGWYVLLSMPRELVLFFPIGALLGGVIGLGQLASSSELVVLQSVGRSRFNIVIAVLKTALPVMVLVMLMGEYLAPITERQADDMKTMARSGGQMTVSSQGVWLREQRDFIHIGAVLRDGTLRDVTRYRFGDQPVLEETAQAATGVYRRGQWVMNKVQRTFFNEHEQVRTEQKDEEFWSLALTPDKLDVVSVAPDELSASGLYDYIRYLHDNGQKAERYELELWRKLVAPIAVIAMMLLAASTVFGPLRSVPMGARIVAGVILGFGFYVANQVFGPMSLVYSVPPLLGALLPSLLFMAFAIWQLSRRR